MNIDSRKAFSMARINFRLTHKIMAIALIGVAAVAVFGAIYMIGATSQDRKSVV